MKYQNGLFILSVAVLGAYCAHAAQNAPSAFSQYGLIQSVNKYSSNPFWNPDSPYNQRMPVPVYATGADLSAGDCNRIVENLITSYCASNNGCTDSQLSDVRPNIMVQLSQLPGHNFATSCGGYIDNIFNNYQKTHGNMSTGTVQYTTTPTVKSTNYVQYENPFKITQNEYQSGVAERTAELERLQRATTASPELEPTYFPKTTADLSFTDRLANTTAGYEPYKDLNSYRTPQFETDAEFYERLKKLNPTEYCKRFPNDDATCKKLFEHNINYVAFGGNTTGCPTKYYTRTGITITCVPTRKKSQFIGWCTDVKLQNCALTQTIAATDEDDKTYWAKWSCLGSAKQINNECVCTDSHMDSYCRCSDPYTVDPSDSTKCICANGGDINDNCGVTPPPPTNCPQGPTIMDTNCECTIIPGTSIDTSTGMCKCDNGKDINNNCQDTVAPAGMPQCLVKMSKDSQFMQPLANLLRNSTRLDINELKTKQVYAHIAQVVHLYCVDSNNASAQDFSEFNTWIDSHDTLPIRIPFNGRIETIDINAEDLFNYNDYSYSILMVYKTPYNMQSSISRDEVTFFSTDKRCVNYTSLAGVIDENYFSGTPAVRKAAKDIYGDRVYNISKSRISFFPGKLLYGSRSSGLNQVKVNNYITARKKLVSFWQNLKSEIDCQNKDIALYLVNDAVIDSVGRTQTVIIKSEPFFIP